MFLAGYPLIKNLRINCGDKVVARNHYVAKFSNLNILHPGKPQFHQDLARGGVKGKQPLPVNQVNHIFKGNIGTADKVGAGMI